MHLLLANHYPGTQGKESFLNTFYKDVLKLQMQKHLLRWDSERIQNNKVKVIIVVFEKRLLNRFEVLFAEDCADSIVLLHVTCIARVPARH